MKSITLTQLHYIAEVAKKQSFGLAAKACFVTQPTLSMQIQKLEGDLGVILFDRSKKPVQPTPTGRKIIEQARVVLQEAFRIEELIETEKGDIKGAFKLGVIPTLAPYLLPLFLERFITDYPKVDLVIEELQTATIITQLKEDTLDAGILVTPLHQKGIIEKPLFHEPFVVYLSPKHPLQKVAKVSEKELSLKDIWLLNEGHCFREQAMDLCKKKKTAVLEHPNLVFESGNLETLKRLVDSNFGYTLLPYLAILDMSDRNVKKKLRFFKPPVPTREVSIAYSRSFLKQGIITALGKTILSILPEELKKPETKNRTIDLPSFRQERTQRIS